MEGGFCVSESIFVPTSTGELDTTAVERTRAAEGLYTVEVGRYLQVSRRGGSPTQTSLVMRVNFHTARKLRRVLDTHKLLRMALRYKPR